jgi:molecular chaperone HscB
LNYFEFYGIPESLVIDQGALKQRYFQLSREYHPDFHATASPEEQARVLELSTLNTRAYQTLNQHDSRLKYVLEQRGALSEGSSNELPPDFLMEMMELNEEIEEVGTNAEPEQLAKLQNHAQEIAREQYQLIKPLLTSFEKMSEEEKQKALPVLKSYYLKKRYLLRIQESLAKLAPPTA